MTAQPDIFLSYNREDQAVAKLYADEFAAAGLSVWWDTALRSGEAYDEVTEAALRAAKAVVVLWSPRSVVSRWVRAEATIADRCKTLVPVTIEPCERPIMFELTQTADLSHWTGDATDKAWRAFLDDVRRMAAKAVSPIPQTPATTAEPPTVEETLKPGQSGTAPSLAVLPFTNRSGLAEDDIFAEGMVEDVTSALSQGVNVRVLGATATMMLNRAVFTDFGALGRQLGVRYLLEGNVRRVGANLLVATQLLEATTGEIVWTAKFDRPLAELAELQEELVTEIAGALDTQVYRLEMERALKKPDNITAWEATVRSSHFYRASDIAAAQNAIDEAKRAIAIAPDYGPGHAFLALTLAGVYSRLSSQDDPVEVQRIRAIADRALALAPEDASVLSNVGMSLCWLGYLEEGERHTGRAMRKAPGSSQIRANHGIACAMLNRAEEALPCLTTAERLSPGWHLMWGVKLWQCEAYRALGRWAEANAAVDESISLLPTNPAAHVAKAHISMQLGQGGEARSHVETARRLGYDLAMAESRWRRVLPNSPTLEADIAIIRALYAAAEECR
jgi:TolB-like protein/Tfp pilus assembly protein PilF